VFQQSVLLNLNSLREDIKILKSIALCQPQSNDAEKKEQDDTFPIKTLADFSAFNKNLKIKSFSVEMVGEKYFYFFVIVNKY